MGSKTPRSRDVLLAVALGARRRAERRVLPDRRSGVERRKRPLQVEAERRFGVERRRTVRRREDLDEGPTLLQKARTRMMRLRRRSSEDRAKIEPMDFAERAARNEEVFRDVNERIEEGAEQHHVEGKLPFHCECGRASCLETIEISAGRYAAIMAERYRFVVLPGHEEPRIERVVDRTPEYVVVEKIGEARKQIDRDHPQQRHHG